MTDYKQIIVGAGTSAHTFLYYAYIGGGTKRGSQFDPCTGRILIVGESDLWQQVADGNKDHKVGQPAHMLALPHEWRLPALGTEFMPVADLVKKQADLASWAKVGLKVDTLRARVLAVTKKGAKHYEVTTSKATTFTAEQVIIATNGPQQKPSGKVLPGNHPRDTGELYQRVVDAVTYMNNLQPAVDTVCIHGSSATSAWAVARAMASGVGKIIWVARSGFPDANPAGRNDEVIINALQKGWMTIGNISKVQVDGAFPSGDDFSQHAPTVKLTFDSYGVQEKQGAYQKAMRGLEELVGEMEARARKKHTVLQVRMLNGDLKPVDVKDGDVIPVNQYVYALGATTLAQTTGAGGILTDEIPLHPVYDEDKRFGDVSNETVVAFTDRDGLWVVGAAVFRVQHDTAKDYANVTKMMAKSGRPPEGILAIVASIRALTGVYGIDNINFATADFKTLEHWVQWVYGEAKRNGKTKLGYVVLPEEIKRFVADQIVALRQHTTFGVEHLSEEGTDGIRRMVEEMLESETTVEKWLPKGHEARWAPPK